MNLGLRSKLIALYPEFPTRKAGRLIDSMVKAKLDCSLGENKALT